MLKYLYSTFESQIYASNLYNEVLDEINSNEFIAQRAFSITDFGISTDFNSEKFVVRVMMETTYEENTWFDTRLSNRPNGDYILFVSNIKCLIDRIKIWVLGLD